MHHALELWGRFLLRFRLPIAVLLVLLGGFAAWHIPKIDFDLSVSELLISPEERDKYHQSQRSFTPLPWLQAAVTWPAPLTGKDLLLARELTDELQASPTTASALSLANIQLASDLPAPDLLLADLLPDHPLINLLADQPLASRRLISADGCSLGFVIQPQRGRGGLGGRDDIKAIFDRFSAKYGLSYRLASTAHVFDGLKDTMRSDLITIILAQLIVMGLFLPFVFRTARGVIIPILSTILANSLFLGLCPVFGKNISMLDLGIPGLILMIVICDAVHLLHSFEDFREQASSRAEAVIQTLRRTGPACVWTSLTTAVGFGSLSLSNHPAITSYGFTAACGVGIGFLVVIVIVPLLLFVWPIRHRAPPNPPNRKRGSFLLRQMPTRWVLVGTLALALLSIPGFLRLEMDERLLGELPDSSPALQNVRWFEDHFTGVVRLEVTISGDLFNPETVRAVEALAINDTDHPAILKTESYVDSLRVIFGHGDDLAPDELLIANMVMENTPDLPRTLISSDLNQGKLVYHLRDAGSTVINALTRNIDAQAQATFPPETKVTVGVLSRMARNSVQTIVQTLLTSLAASLLIITLLVWFVFKSWRLALASIPANLIPILLAIAAAGLLGIPLRIGVVVVFCIGLGLAIDDSIHFLARFNAEDLRHLPLEERIRQSLHSTGRALIQTSIILGLGAICYLPADFRVMFDNGLLLLVIIVAALAADLFLLPVILRRLYGPVARTA